MSGSRHIHLQPLGGIAGDMFVAAMLDAFPDLAATVLADVAAAVPAEVGAPRLENAVSHGIAARRFALAEAGTAIPAEAAEMATAGAGAEATNDGGAPRRYRRKHAATSAAAAGASSAANASGPQPGTYRALREIIESARLSGSAARHALGILRVLAEAEAAIHDLPPDDVHFHELAAWDSLMDVVAAGSAISALGAATWSIDSLPLGGGRVATQHGPLPVPPPATERILRGFPWHSDGIGGERVTPTGAAIVRYLVDPGAAGRGPAGRLLASGYGAGTRHLPGMANVLRVMAFEAALPAENEGTVASVQFDIDDMTGEEIGIAADRLRSLPGVLDLVLIPAQGKKGRPVTMFQLLAAPDALPRCSDAIFAETSTIGLRWTLCERVVLPREVRHAGDGVRVKEVLRPDGRLTRKAESDDLRAIDGLLGRRARKSDHEGEP